MANLDQLVKHSADPQTCTLRVERLFESADAQRLITELDPTLTGDLISIISISNFLFHTLVRYPEMIALIGQASNPDDEQMECIGDMDTLRRYKYEELLKITWMDVSGYCGYQEVLVALNKLATVVIKQSMRLVIDAESYNRIMDSLCVIALGKLGAGELNYSSDVDLIFVSVNQYGSISDYQELQKFQIAHIRKINQALEQITADGFLYRVDLKLRPWGNSGPLIMSIDDTEHYYEASSEPWERFAWLRAKPIAGFAGLGEDLLGRMRPFIYMHSLSTDDLNRFIEIKNNMSKARKRERYWNVKLGEGGIRDIEFFIQMLQAVNASKYPVLQTTNTLSALRGLRTIGLIDSKEETEIQQSYIFLRRLENRLQIVNEQQTHDLPNEKNTRLVLARSLAQHCQDNDTLLNDFEDELIMHRTIASRYFERILPGEKP